MTSLPREPEDAPSPRPKRWVRVVVLLATLLTAWHILASFLWIAPYSANAREIVPGKLLSSYMLPLFGQSWSVFAPEPINGDYRFEVRAVIVGDDGREQRTDWVSATDVELSMIQRNLFPPRAGIQSSEVASGYKNAFDRLDRADRSILGGDFTTGDWRGEMRESLENSQGDEGGEGGTTDERTRKTRIAQALAEERLSTAYATQVAKAMWGDEVQRVQYRVSRQNVVPFAQRHDPAAERPSPTVVEPGWRGLLVEQGQNERNFAEVFRGQHERLER